MHSIDLSWRLADRARCQAGRRRGIASSSLTWALPASDHAAPHRESSRHAGSYHGTGDIWQPHGLLVFLFATYPAALALGHVFGGPVRYDDTHDLDYHRKMRDGPDTADPTGSG